jgi:hypothetical protein
LGLRALAVAIAPVIIGVMTAAVAVASSQQRADQPPVVSAHFRHVGAAVSIWGGTRYALAAGGSPIDDQTGVTLIDDHTGQLKMISRAGCAPGEPSTLEPLDLPWVTFDCSQPTGGLGPLGVGPPAPELYSPASRQWRAVVPSPGVSPVCTDTGCTDLYFAEAAGSSWLQYDHATCDSRGQHCSSNNVFQNITTSELRQDPSGGTTTVDLNAPNLTQRVCRPLRVPAAFQPYAPGPAPGSLTFYGRFALAIGGNKTGSRAYLERCGTHLHRLLTDAPVERPTVVAANTHEVVWMSHPHFLSALTLPGLRPFTITLPKRLVARTCSPDDYSTCVAQLALTNHRLYLLTATASYPEPLWAAPSPLPARHQPR